MSRNDTHWDMTSSPVLRWSLLIMLSFAAASAAVGGVMGVFFDGAGVPHRYLDGTPFDSFVAPGLILGVVVGGTHAVAAGCVFRHRIVRGGARPTARRDTRHPRELIVLSVHPQSVDAQQVHQDRSSIVGAALPWSALQHRVQAPCATGRVFTLVQAHVVVAP